MSKNIKINLQFGADISQAKKSFVELSNMLTQIQSTPSKLVDDSSIRQANQAAMELQQHLAKAVNVDTGRLDLSRLSQSFKRANVSLTDYYNILKKIGPEGEKAFLGIARSIATAETPTMRLNKTLSNFMDMVKKTAKWQISSNITHSIQGALQHAYGYAQDLNASLNDIRIVTGYSADQMARFAVEANKAAKELSTTTTAYTEASLIFYQQGLKGNEVTERANTVIKMANVTGEAAYQVSDYMTAVWNNFDDGSKSLAYYADVMTALGAATASSTDEIANGLEKFAAVSETVGLSYEYATAALATVTATTRQSADVVGTAFKTLFSRIQDLELGKTLDDGTTLGKYSQALDAVGINIKDVNGEMKSMDSILDELGAKWTTLGKDQQIALAQTVAGARQYTQLMALMSNWDFMQKNIQTAKGSEGELERQAAIYAESWEAASKRVQASAENIYDSLLNDKFFIAFNNGIATLLDGIGGFIDGLGGMGGVITTIGGIFLRFFAKEMPRTINNLKSNFAVLSGSALKSAQGLQAESSNLLNQQEVGEKSTSWDIQLQGITRVNEMQQQLAANYKNLSVAERQAYEAQIQTTGAIYETIAARAKENEQLEEKQDTLTTSILKSVGDKGYTKGYNELQSKDNQKEPTVEQREQAGRNKSTTATKKANAELTKYIQLLRQKASLEKTQMKAQQQVQAWEQQAKGIKKNSAEYKKLQAAMSEFIKLNETSINTTKLTELNQALESSSLSAEELIAKFREFANNKDAFKIDIKVDKNKFKAAGFEDLDKRIQDSKQHIVELGGSSSELDQLATNTSKLTKNSTDLNDAIEQADKNFEGFGEHTVTTSEALTSMAGGLMQLGSLMTTVSSSFTTIFNDENASAVEKIGAGIALLTTLFFTFTGVVEALDKLQERNAGTKLESAAADGAVATGSGVVTAAKTAETAAVHANTTAWLSNIVIIAGVLMVVAAAIGGVTAYLENQTKELKENAKEWQDKADKTAEEAKRNEELVNSYKEALKLYQKTGEGIENLETSIWDLIEAYDIENGAILAKTKNYQDLTKAINEARQAELNKLIEDTRIAAEGNIAVVGELLTEGAGQGGDESYYGDFDDGGSAEDEKSIHKVFQNTKFDYLQLNSDSNDIDFDVDLTNVYELYAFVEELIKLKKEAVEVSKLIKEDLNQSELYQAINDKIKSLSQSEEYKNYKKDIETLDQSYLEQAASQAGDVTQIETEKQLNDFKQQYLKNYKKILQSEYELTENSSTWKLKLEQAEKYFNSIESLQSLIRDQEAFESKFKDSSDYEAIKKWYNDELTEEQKNLLLTLNVDSKDSLNAVKESLEQAQRFLDTNELQYKFTVSDSLQKAWSKGDWNEIKKFFDESESQKIGGKTYEDFEKMSYQQQQQFIQEINSITSADVYSQTQSALVKYIEEKAEAETRATEAATAYNDAITEHENSKKLSNHYAGNDEIEKWAHQYRETDYYEIAATFGEQSEDFQHLFEVIKRFNQEVGGIQAGEDKDIDAELLDDSQLIDLLYAEITKKYGLAQFFGDKKGPVITSDGKTLYGKNTASKKDVVAWYLRGQDKSTVNDEWDVIAAEDDRVIENNKTALDKYQKNLFALLKNTQYGVLFQTAISTVDEKEKARADAKETSEKANSAVTGMNTQLEETRTEYNKFLSLVIAETITQATYAEAFLSESLNYEEDYTLDQINYFSQLDEAAKSYFTLMADGTYRLIGNAEELSKILTQAHINKLVDFDKAYENATGDKEGYLTKDFFTYSVSQEEEQIKFLKGFMSDTDLSLFWDEKEKKVTDTTLMSNTLKRYEAEWSTGMDAILQSGSKEALESLRETGIVSSALIGHFLNKINKETKQKIDEMLNNIQKENVQFGTSIDEDTVAHLDTMGIAWQDYFTLMADGTYRLIGNAEEFKRKVEEARYQESKQYFTAFTGAQSSHLQSYSKELSMDEIFADYGNTENDWQNKMRQNTQMSMLQNMGYDVTSFAEFIDNPDGLQAPDMWKITDTEAYQAALTDAKDKFIQSAFYLDPDELASILPEDTEWFGEALEQSMLGEAQRFDIDLEEYETYKGLLVETGEIQRRNYKTEEQYQRALHNTTKAHLRFTKGFKDIQSNWEEYNEIMTDSETSLYDIAEVTTAIKPALQDMLNLDDAGFEMLSEDFVSNNWSLIQDVMNGVDGSINNLQEKASEDILLNVTGKTNLEQVNDEILDLHSSVLKGNDLDFAVGIAIDENDKTGFFNACAQMVAAAEMTKEEAEAYFASMGYDAELEQVTTPVTTEYEYPNVTMENGVPIVGEPATVKITTTNQVGSWALKSITPNGSYGGDIDIDASPGGSSSGSKSAVSEDRKKTKKSDVVDRYKEINDQLDNTQDAIDDASKAADRLWGNKRIAAMKKIVEEQKKEINLLKQKRAEAEQYLKLDQQDLNKTASEYGITFEFDSETGDITNYTEIMNGLWKELEAAETYGYEADNFSTKEAQDEWIEKNVDPVNEKIDAIKEAIGQYDDTKELIEDLDNEIQDSINAWQDDNHAVFTAEIELELEITELKLKKLDYDISKLDTDTLSEDLVEYASLNWSVNDEDGIQSKVEFDIEGIDKARKDLDDLNALYNSFDENGNRKISDAAYVEERQKILDRVIDHATSLNEVKDNILNYYGDFLSLIDEEFQESLDLIDIGIEKLDHYSDLLSLAGRETDHDAMAAIYAGKAEVIGDQISVLQGKRAMYEQELQTAQALGDEDTIKEIMNKINEVDAEIRSKVKEQAEAIKAEYEEKLSSIEVNLEKALTGGTSFDDISTAMERANSLQEEYLTTTNKIYETNKLINKAQQDIDKTTNTVAKNRLNNFIKETEQLQKQSQLSEYELKIQQAKYDLILAEIALEEAQNAKSTVRLQRDAEGNFGYVYTADQDKIADAQQKFEDAQNSLYNIGLEGANNYTQKYQQTLAEWYDTYTELTRAWMSGEIESEEEFNNKMAAAKEYYYEKLKQYSSLYSISLTTDSNVVRDAWTTDFADMVYETDTWEANFETALGQAETYISEWKERIGELLSDTGLDDIETTVGNITTYTGELADTVKNTTIPELMNLSKALNETLVPAFQALNKEISTALGAAEEIMEEVVTEDSDGEAGKEEPSSDSNPEEPNNPPSSNEAPETPTPETDATLDVSIGDQVKLKPGVTHFSRDGGNGTRMKSWVPGWSPFDVMSQDDDEILLGINGGYTGWVWKKDLEAFDTGGYTGEWGPEGKLAVLHQKEIVLDQDDTANFLSALGVLDNIIAVIDNNSINTQLARVLSSPMFSMFNRDILEQNVHIEASFPEVTDKYAIEEALNSLILKASQYANRKY